MATRSVRSAVPVMRGLQLPGRQPPWGVPSWHLDRAVLGTRHAMLAPRARSRQARREHRRAARAIAPRRAAARSELDAEGSGSDDRARGELVVVRVAGHAVGVHVVGQGDERPEVRSDDLLLISGSLPDSVPASVVAEILEIGREAGARTLVDIHSEALRVAYGSRPWMLKCNRRELLELLGASDIDARLGVVELAAEMGRIRDHGIEVVVVTMGAEGALLVDADGAVHAVAPRISEVNPTGSGDLLLAGLAVGIEEGQAPREAIALGVACGTAGATHLPPELPADFERATWLPRVTLEVVADAA